MLYYDTFHEVNFKMCIFQAETYNITWNNETQSVVKHTHSSIQMFYQLTFNKDLVCVRYCSNKDVLNIFSVPGTILGIWAIKFTKYSLCS